MANRSAAFMSKPGSIGILSIHKVQCEKEEGSAKCGLHHAATLNELSERLKPYQAVHGDPPLGFCHRFSVFEPQNFLDVRFGDDASQPLAFDCRVIPVLAYRQTQSIGAKQQAESHREDR
jgi:hypothetical protein